MVVIDIEEVWKKYTLGAINNQSLREEWINWWKKKNDVSVFWALQNINMQIQQGETVGIIGKNGSGKSTLLKILSKITTPTKGKVSIKGKMSSLLEVGTGFHPELTGKENIFLNGAILGMTKRDIKHQLDEIIDFAGVEAFIDTPVKRYSSGMYVRLAFSVAAHLRNDVIIVDEVLAVGDAEFQKKCLGKLQILTDKGKTSIIVSHQLSLIENLCSRLIVLDKGGIKYNSVDVGKTIALYQQEILHSIKQIPLKDRTDRQRHPQFLFTHITLFDEEQNMTNFATTGKFLKIRLYYETNTQFSEVSVAIRFKDLNGGSKTLVWTKFSNKSYEIANTNGYIDCIFPKLALSPHTYSLNILAETPFEKLDWIQDAYIIQVTEGRYYDNASVNTFQESFVYTDFIWE